ncbi:uncharacterized protein BX664DRAFT_349930 [Halteromyces radiatus]|uniref:uncharacterized protein n=1 Tax=Halteromyces radiatus TaxID=101107 RepID=UPI00221FE3B5|nr:uncharacterized protein BX664DRAFT_349930 [Halteromyces radiatus]KAI8089544.1 hypothetical protein BX664DRAFT_349930 [Halteromyces radiatus]
MALSSLIKDNTSIHHPQKKDSKMMIIRTIDRLETKLNYLQTDCTLIDIVVKSLQSFFLVKPLTTAEQLIQVDKELSIAHDNVLVQIRALHHIN